MATIDLGKVKLVWRGTYSGSFNYVPDDVVEYTDGSVTSTYICVANSTGNAPSSGGSAHSSWNYMAKGQASSPTTTQGDIIVRGASADGRLAIGAAGKVLKVNSSGNGLEYGGAGITQTDQWYVNADFTGTVDPITIVSRFTTGGSYIGSGMSASSGVFTFPTTGYWLVSYQARVSRVDAGHQSRYQYLAIKSTTDNFSSSEVLALGEAGFYDNYNAGYRYHGAYCSGIFDCTNTSTHKVRFATSVEDNSNNGVRWHTPYMTMTFIKLADT